MQRSKTIFTQGPERQIQAFIGKEIWKKVLWNIMKILRGVLRTQGITMGQTFKCEHMEQLTKHWKKLKALKCQRLCKMFQKPVTFRMMQRPFIECLEVQERAAFHIRPRNKLQSVGLLIQSIAGTILGGKEKMPKLTSNDATSVVMPESLFIKTFFR